MNFFGLKQFLYFTFFFLIKFNLILITNCLRLPYLVRYGTSSVFSVYFIAKWTNYERNGQKKVKAGPKRLKKNTFSLLPYQKIKRGTRNCYNCNSFWSPFLLYGMARLKKCNFRCYHTHSCVWTHPSLKLLNRS